MLTFLLLTKHGLKSKFKLDIPNYTITYNVRPRWKGGGAAILVSNNVKFGIVDTGSFFDTDINVITVILKNSQLSTNISNIYITPASKCAKSVRIRSIFWSIIFCIRAEWGNLLRKSPYSVRIQENTDQKKSVFGHFSSSTSDNNDDKFIPPDK